MITLKGSKFFTKLDIRWGYNNVRIKEGDKWKATFITNKGLFKPTVMFFGLRNSPATFQAMMDDYFRDMIDEGWITIYSDSNNCPNVLYFLIVHNIASHSDQTEPKCWCM
jgi:hypothetical protein